MTAAHTEAPTPIASYVAQARHWMEAGRPDHAAHLYGLALDLVPDDLRLRMQLADCLVRCGQHTAAASAYLKVALGYSERRRDRETLAFCYRVLHLDPAQFVYVATADLLRRIGRQARPICGQAAEIHLAAGRLGDGLQMLRLGVEIDHRNPEARQRLATLYLDRHMYTEAVTNLAEAGRLLLAAGNNGAYVELAEQILRIDPRHLETLRELPRVYLRVGEPQRAVTKLSNLMRVSPGDTVGYEILAHAFAVIGRVTTSLSVLRRLVDELSTTGRRAQAEAIIERARGWKTDDAKFVGSVLALRNPPVPRPERPRAQQSPAGDTVVLSIADLMAAAEPTQAAADGEDMEFIDAAELVELADVEGTVMLRLQDFSFVGPAPVPPPAPRRTPPPPPPVPRVARPAAVAVSTKGNEQGEVEELELADIELEELAVNAEPVEHEPPRPGLRGATTHVGHPPFARHRSIPAHP